VGLSENRRLTINHSIRRMTPAKRRARSYPWAKGHATPGFGSRKPPPSATVRYFSREFTRFLSPSCVIINFSPWSHGVHMGRASLLTLTIFISSCASLAADEPVDYAKQIKPLLKERCFTCHGALRQKGKLRL